MEAAAVVKLGIDVFEKIGDSVRRLSGVEFDFDVAEIGADEDMDRFRRRRIGKQRDAGLMPDRDWSALILCQ